jgi:hypothetical protein
MWACRRTPSLQACNHADIRAAGASSECRWHGRSRSILVNWDAGLLHGRAEGHRLCGVRRRADGGGCAARPGPHVSGGPRGKSGKASETVTSHVQPQMPTAVEGVQYTTAHVMMLSRMPTSCTTATLPQLRTLPSRLNLRSWLMTCCRLRCRSRWSSRSRAASGQMTTVPWARRHAAMTVVTSAFPRQPA